MTPVDSGMRAMADAVGEARRQLRENALPKARDDAREKVEEAQEPLMLGVLAALVESAGELADALAERVTTPDTRKAYVLAGRRLRDEARNLKGDEKDAAERVK